MFFRSSDKNEKDKKENKKEEKAGEKIIVKEKIETGKVNQFSNIKSTRQIFQDKFIRLNCLF